MKNYSYKGVDKAGATVAGSIDAIDKIDALEKLDSQEIFVFTISEVETNSANSALSSKNLGLRDKLYMLKELALLTSAGMRFDKSLNLIADNTESAALQKIASDLSDKIRSGSMISSAFSDYVAFFGSTIVTLLKVAEETGNLNRVLHNISEDLEHQVALRSKIIQAITYPAVIFAVSILSVVFILNYVVPNIATIFAGKENIPTYTYLLLELSSFFRLYQFHMLLAVLAIVFIFIKMKDYIFSSNKVGSFLLTLPVFGQFILQTSRMRFSDSVSLMLRSGVVLDKAMQLSVDAVKNATLKKELEIAIEKLKQGQKISVCLAKTTVFSKYYSSIIAVGEESGQLEQTFTEVGLRSRKRFEEWIDRITALLEPLMILFMGAIVGTIVVIMIASITSATDLAI